MEDSKTYIRKEEDFGGDDSDGYSLEPTFGEKEGLLKESIIPVIQGLDKKVHYYRGGTLYSFNFLDNCSYAQLEKLRNELVRRYNEALAEEDRANGETVRLNGLSGEFQAVKKESHEANHLLCQIVIASASGFLGDPAKRKTEIIVKVAEYLDRIHYQFQHNHKEEN